MKKIWILVVVLLIAVALCGIYFLFTKAYLTKDIKKEYAIQENTVGTFNLDNYSDKIERFYSGEILGPTLTAEDAKEKALPILKEKFGVETFKRKEPYNVSYDSNNRAWHVFGSLTKGCVGGVTHVIITQDDGIVLAVWGEK